MQEEILDLVDANDQVIGQIERNEFHQQEANPPGYIRGVEFLIQNDLEQLWIPTRTAHKRIAPNALDYSMGGHVDAGESYIQAALREIREELNLDLREEDLELVHTFTPTPEVPYFRALYIYRSNEAPHYNPEDYVSAEWLSPRQILDKIDAGAPAKTSLRPTIKYLLTAS